MKRSEILGLEGAAVNQEGLQYCLLFMHKSCMNKQRKSLSHAAWATKPFGIVHESVFRHQGGQPKVSHRALWWEAYGIHHFWGPQFGPLHQNCGSVTRGTPARCVTQNCRSLDYTICTRNEPSHCWKRHAMHLISIAGTMAPPTRYYMYLCGILQTHGLPHQEKHYQC